MYQSLEPRSLDRELSKCRKCDHASWNESNVDTGNNVVQTVKAETGARHGDGSKDKAVDMDLFSLLCAFFACREQDLRCEKCGAATVQIQPRLKELPRVLILHLKRFQPNLCTSRYEKNNVFHVTTTDGAVIANF